MFPAVTTTTDHLFWTVVMRSFFAIVFCVLSLHHGTHAAGNGFDELCDVQSNGCEQPLLCVNRKCGCGFNKYFDGTRCLDSVDVNFLCSGLRDECKFTLQCIHNECSCGFQEFFDGVTCRSAEEEEYTPEPRNASCTTSRAGLNNCDFNRGFCGFQLDSKYGPNSLTWERGTTVTDMAGDTIQDGWDARSRASSFVYLNVTDPNIPVGSIARLRGGIASPFVKAICIELHYATTSSSGVPSFTIYNIKRKYDWDPEITIGTVTGDTMGEWKVARFHSCVKSMSWIGIESMKIGDGSLVALDYIGITQSNMDCPDEATTKAPTTNPTTPTPTTTKTTPTRTATRKTTPRPTPTTTRKTTPRPPPTTTRKTTPRPTPTTTRKTTPTTTGPTTTARPTTTATTRRTTSPRSTLTTTTSDPRSIQTPYRHDFHCDHFTMSVHIPVSMLPNSKLTLRDSNCVLKNDGVRYTLDFSFDQCGSSIIYYTNVLEVTNEVKVHKDFPIHSPLPIVFDPDFNIPIKCTINRTLVIGGGIEAVTHDPFEEKPDKIHKVNYSLKEFRTDEYLDEITAFPVKIPLNREVFIELSSDESHPTLGINVEECVATPTNDPNDPAAYTLVLNDCPSSPAVHEISSSTGTKRRFKVQTFHFRGSQNHHNRVYIHCRTKYCFPSSCDMPLCSARHRERRSSRRRQRRAAVKGEQLRNSRKTVYARTSYTSLGPFDLE